MARELAVWLFADRVGTLTPVDGRLTFCYTPEWLSRLDALPLSASLPLQAEPFDDRHTRPFFAGLLPEGQLRRLIAQQFQVSSQNDFALLDALGGECAGAVTFLQPGQALPAPHATDDGNSLQKASASPRRRPSGEFWSWPSHCPLRHANFNRTPRIPLRARRLLTKSRPSLNSAAL